MALEVFYYWFSGWKSPLGWLVNDNTAQTDEDGFRFTFRKGDRSWYTSRRNRDMFLRWTGIQSTKNKRTCSRDNIEPPLQIPLARITLTIHFSRLNCCIPTWAVRWFNPSTARTLARSPPSRTRTGFWLVATASRLFNFGGREWSRQQCDNSYLCQYSNNNNGITGYEVVGKTCLLLPMLYFRNILHLSLSV